MLEGRKQKQRQQKKPAASNGNKVPVASALRHLLKKFAEAKNAASSATGSLHTVNITQTAPANSKGSPDLEKMLLAATLA
jgi:hypothetical protein